MSVYLIALLAMFAQIGGGNYPGGSGEATLDANGDPIFRAATIKAEEDSIISAEAEGTLIRLPIKEGDRMTEGTVMATIDDRQAKAAVDVAKIGYEAALEKSKDDVEERYAIASKQVAEVDWRKDKEANLRIPNSVTEIQVMQKKLVLDRSDLQIEKAKKDQVIAAKEAAVKEAEMRAAEIGLARRTTKAPFDGEVQEIFQKEAQWVNPGDPIARLVKFDTLRVECYVKTDNYDPTELAGKPVTVTVKLARDREATIPGRITYVSQTVEQGLGAYLVRAEVENQRNGDYWLIRPGLPAQMTIHVNQPAQPQARGAAPAAK
jgi:multidrug efflux pump subunit AcrA (membrane-fusion protein)